MRSPARPGSPWPPPALGGCATAVPPHEIERLAGPALEEAEDHLGDGNPAEAAYLTEAVLRADRDHPRALASRNERDLLRDLAEAEARRR